MGDFKANLLWFSTGQRFEQIKADILHLLIFPTESEVKELKSKLILKIFAHGGVCLSESQRGS